MVHLCYLMLIAGLFSAEAATARAQISGNSNTPAILAEPSHKILSHRDKDKLELELDQLRIEREGLKHELSLLQEAITERNKLVQQKDVTQKSTDASRDSCKRSNEEAKRLKRQYGPEAAAPYIERAKHCDEVNDMLVSNLDSVKMELSRIEADVKRIEDQGQTAQAQHEDALTRERALIDNLHLRIESAKDAISKYDAATKNKPGS
jgi:hypothetical protein